MFRQFMSFVLVVSILGGPPAAAAQDGPEDWDLTEDAEKKLVAATAIFSNGVVIALRCLDGRYDALIGGLPATADAVETRPLSLQFGDEPYSERPWSVTQSRSAAISTLPAPLARQLRKGGLVKVRVREGGETGRRVRYDLELPASTTAIDRTLTACGRPLVDPRDSLLADLDETGLPGGITWARPPIGRYPTGQTYERGEATVSCLAYPDGNLRDCVIESQNPIDGGFGEAALAATRRAIVRFSGEAQAPGLLTYTTRFRMLDDVEAMNSASSRSRLRGS